jgi:hypothetical protein
MTLEPAPSRGPIFIIGAMGSGTTLLRMMLDSHEHIAIPHETGFMRGYKSLRFIPFKWTGYGWAYRMGWSKEEFDQELARFFDGIFRRYVELHGKRRWGEKTPLHTWHIDSMARIFPEAVFVGLVRHPGATAASNMSRFRHTLKKAVTHYSRYNREIARQAARYSDRFVLLRYEELLLHTEPALRELLEWLGEPWSDSVLRHDEIQAAREAGRYDRVEGQSKAEPVDASRLDKWARAMPPARRRHIAERLGRLGELFGYSMDEPTRLEPLHARESHLISGAELEARFADFHDLDIETRGRVPSYEQYYNPRQVLLKPNRTGEAPRAIKPPPPPPQPPTGLRRALLPVARRVPAPARRRLRKAARSLKRAPARGR